MEKDSKNPRSFTQVNEIILCLQRELHQQQRLVNQQKQELDKKKEELEKQKIEIESYKAKYLRLLEELRLNKSRLYSASSEKNNWLGDLFDEPGVELSEELKEQLTDAIEIKTHERKKHPVRRSLPKALPRETIFYDISEEEKICPCGASLVKIGEEMTEQLKYIPAQLSVVQHVRFKYACRPCQENVKIAPLPVLFLPKCIATPELVAHTVIAKYADHIPLYRQEAMWSRLEIDLPRSSLCGWVLKTAELCDPLVKLMQKIIVTHDYVQADETTVQVMKENDRENTTKSFMWCYRGGGKNPTIVYEYQPTRGGHHAEQFLKGFTGYLQSDAYSGYNFANKNTAIIRVGCMAHARRKFAEVVKISKSNGIANEALNYFRALYKIESQAREQNLSSDQRFLIRQEKAQPLLTALKAWLDMHLTKIPEQSKLGGALRYSLSQWELLTHYLKDGRVEIDNNLVENAIRPFAVGRKNWLFAGSPNGARAGAVLYSLIETSKANKLEPYQYLCALFHRIRFCTTEENYRQLLPQYIQL